MTHHGLFTDHLMHIRHKHGKSYLKSWALIWLVGLHYIQLSRSSAVGLHTFLLIYFW